MYPTRISVPPKFLKEIASLDNQELYDRIAAARRKRINAGTSQTIIAGLCGLRGMSSISLLESMATVPTVQRAAQYLIAIKSACSGGAQ